MLPYIEVSGTHREIGQAIGESLKKEIKQALGLHLKKIKIKTDGFNFGFKKLTKTAERFFPGFVEEIKGMSEGSGESFENLMIFSFEEELLPAEHCTSLAVRTGKGIIFAHNEDWDVDLPLYVIKAKPKNRPEFLSVATAGHFAGSVVGYNEYGMIFSGNSISTKINFNGLPKIYCLRKFLELSSVDDVVGFVSDFPRAIGNHSLLVSAKEKRIVSLEWSPENLEVEEAANGIVHTNHFVFSKMKSKQTEPSSAGSLRRFDFANEQIAIKKKNTIRDVKKIMATHFEKGRGVCQHWEWKTLSSVIIDTNKREMLVSEGNPCKHPYKKFVL